MLLTAVAVPACGAAPPALPEPAKKGTWQSPVLKKALPIELFVPKPDAPGAHRRRPGIIYLKGLNAPRIGREKDESIIADFLKQGYLVLTVDYGNDPKAVAPHINHDLRVMRRDVKRTRKNPGLFAPQRVQENWVYMLPAGYRLARDIPYYGAKGEFRLDIRYPSKAAKPVPVVMQNPVDNGNRMGNDVQWQYNDLIAEGFLTRGYAIVQIDNPVKRYRGVDPMPDIAHKLKAAVRTVRANAKRYNLDGKHIGVMGFSRGSGQAGILAMSGGIKALERGMHLKYSSRVQVALLHAGRMDHLGLLEHCPRMGKQYLDRFGDPVKNRKVWDAHSAISYVTADDPPTFLSVGEKDWYRTEQIRRMAAALKKAGVEHVHAVTPGMEHMVTDDVKILGQIYDFFDKHLKTSKEKGK